MPQIARVARRLRADITKLERHTGCLSRFVEPGTHCFLRKRAAIRVLNQVQPRYIFRPATYPVNDILQITLYCDTQVLLGLVLDHVKVSILDITSFYFS